MAAGFARQGVHGSPSEEGWTKSVMMWKFLGEAEMMIDADETNCALELENKRLKRELAIMTERVSREKARCACIADYSRRPVRGAGMSDTPICDNAFGEAQDFAASAFVVPLDVARDVEVKLADITKWKDDAAANAKAFAQKYHNDITMKDDALEEKLAAMTKQRDVLAQGIKAVDELIDNSQGIGGLHLNGEFATWKELRTGGWMEDWLFHFDGALRALEKPE
jgi:hypothetical protein